MFLDREMIPLTFVLNIFLICISSLSTLDTMDDFPYMIGAGIADVTGPAAEVNMMGYAKPDQTSGGIHFRLFSRAFIIQDSVKRVVFVSVDCGMIATLIKLEVISRLQTMYGNIYTEKNVVLSGTHTHSGTAGFHQYILYQVTSLGFIKESFEALVCGIVKSIQRAHDNVKPGRIFIANGELDNSNINRSPTAYLNNPESERIRYSNNVDKTMTLLKLVDNQNQSIGIINWFPVHCTSMNNTNTLLSGDNKGYASYLFERKMNETRTSGMSPFVAAFAQSHEGDVSPNTRGPHCLDTGLPCDMTTSTCNKKTENCVASGPGANMFESTRIIGQQQFEKAQELFNTATEMIEGPVDFIHQYVDMSQFEVNLGNGTKVKTCKPAMGYSFAAGTTDGPGVFDFTQGDKTGNAFWNFVRNIIKKPSDEMIHCQYPKPILLPTGEINFPYQWQPTIVETQLLRLGNLIIIAVPGEFTTMSGRRLMNAVENALSSINAGNNSHIVVAGLSNSYTGYITTFEEYQIQRYEGASTIYGPYSLQAYIQQFSNLTVNLMKDHSSFPPGPPPPNLRSKQLTFLPPVIYDSTPLFKKFGDVKVDAESNYTKGTSVSVIFVSGHPRNNLQLEGTFLTVEYKDPTTNTWKVICTDRDWETKFIWRRVHLAESEATIIWDIPSDTKDGTYRICHFGHSKSLLGTITPYSGTSRDFQIN